MIQVITFEPTFLAWRKTARDLLTSKVAPELIVWQPQDGKKLALVDSLSEQVVAHKKPLNIPREFMEQAEVVSAHREDETWGLLYRLAFRLVYENKNLLHIKLDPDVLEFDRKLRLVTRDLHKMKAFVRFKEIKSESGSLFIAWHRPDHRILRFAAPFFTDRFNGMEWIIFTEEESMIWKNRELSFGPGISQKEAAVLDNVEDLWKTYYGSVFNPARIKIQAMKNELPVRHWKTLPEASLIDQLIDEAPARVEKFIQTQKPSAKVLIPKGLEAIDDLKNPIKKCQACDICSKATQSILGVGPHDARIVFVGEQPGDEEDKNGIPFIGPAGNIFNNALTKAGLKREKVFITNAVKAFKWKNIEGRRQHRGPSAEEIAACRPWLKAELDLVKPDIIVCLGATAAQSVMGKLMSVHDSQGTLFKSAWTDQTVILSHPAAILRTKDEVIREKMLLEFERSFEFIAQLVLQSDKVSITSNAISATASNK